MAIKPPRETKAVKAKMRKRKKRTEKKKKDKLKVARDTKTMC